MKFPNALRGVKKIFASEILGLIGAILMAVTLICGMLMTVYTVLTVPTIICGAVSGVLMLTSYILTIVGISQASKDDNSFRYALFVLIFGIVFSLCSGFLTSAAESNAYIQRLLSIVPDLINLFVMVFVVMGIRNLALQLNDLVMDGKGKNIMTIIFVMEMIIFVARSVTSIIQVDVVAEIAIIAVGFAGVLSIVTYILYLSYLSKAKKMLAAK